MTKSYLENQDETRIRFSPCPVSPPPSRSGSEILRSGGLHGVIDTPSPNLEIERGAVVDIGGGWERRAASLPESILPDPMPVYEVNGNDVIEGSVTANDVFVATDLTQKVLNLRPSRLPSQNHSRSTSATSVPQATEALGSSGTEDIAGDEFIQAHAGTTAVSGQEFIQAHAGMVDKGHSLYEDIDSNSNSGLSNGSDIGLDQSTGALGGSLSRVPSREFIAMCNSQNLYVRGRFEKWELSRAEIKILNKLGEGDGGVIHAAKWRGLKCVAKMLRTDGDQTKRRINPQVARQDLINEITVLSHLRHPNLVLFLGACCKGEPLIILNEFLPGGNLEEVILKTWNNTGQWRPGHAKVLLWATELARALAFLHNCTTPIIHRDLKPANLLLDADGHLKVCDFGLSRLRRLQNLGSTYQMTGKTGSLRYMAPEVFQQNPCYDERVDIYSTGMILWFLVTGIRPFDRSSAEFVARKAAKHQRRPPLEPVKTAHSVAMASIIDRCWSHHPQHRPSALELLRDLELLSSYQNLVKTELAELAVPLQLEAHALFHQAVVGPCKEPSPPFWAFGPLGPKAKHKAWMKISTLKPTVAFDQLNLLLDDCCPAWRTGSHRTIHLDYKVAAGRNAPKEATIVEKPEGVERGEKQEGIAERTDYNSDSGRHVSSQMGTHHSRDAEDLSSKETVPRASNEIRSAGGDADGFCSRSYSDQDLQQWNAAPRVTC